LVGANGAGKTILLDIPVLNGDMLRKQVIVGAFFERQETGRREILAGAGYMPKEAAKPPHATEVLEYLRRHYKMRAFNAEFGKLAEAMSVRQRQEPAFVQLRDQLCAWFPGQS
jgi:ABC-type multidrug transport system ATPase subunit